MITRPERRLFPKILFFIIFIGILVFLNQKGYLSSIKNSLASLFTFGSKSTGNAAQESRLTLGTLFSLREIQKTNQEVNKLELDLKTTNLEKEELEKENAALRDQLKLLPRKKFTLLGADVIARDPVSLEEFILINRGKKDGLKEGMPVIIFDRILVGHVYQAEEEKAKILLSVSPLNTFNAALAKDQVTGVAKGKYNLEITLELIPNQTSLNQGELVITSGKQQQYPQGLLIGEVVSTSQSPDGLFKQAVVKPFYRTGNLKQVFVIVD